MLTAAQVPDSRGAHDPLINLGRRTVVLGDKAL